MNNNFAVPAPIPPPANAAVVEELPFPTGPLYLYALRTGAMPDISGVEERLNQPNVVRLRTTMLYLPGFLMEPVSQTIWTILMLYYTIRGYREHTLHRVCPDPLKLVLAVLVLIQTVKRGFSRSTYWLWFYSGIAYYLLGRDFSPTLLDLQHELGLASSWFDDMVTHILYRYRNLNNLHALIGRCEERLGNDFRVGAVVRKLTEPEKRAGLMALSRAAAVIHQLVEQTDFGQNAGQLRQTQITSVLNELSRPASDYGIVGQHGRR